MRDYILTQSIARDSTFAFPKLRRMIRSWFQKRNLKALEALDAHMLDDIGLVRADIRHLYSLPLEVDLLEELVRIRDCRARNDEPVLSEEVGHGPVQRPEPLQPRGIGRREGRIGFNLGGNGGLGTHGGEVLPLGG